MSQRSGFTKWLWCLFAVFLAPGWGRAVSVRVPPKNPTTIEAQAKFFQDFFSVQLSPYKIEFGHVCEDPNTWEQRYEKKDFKNHRDMGKVRWGDKQGGYGEHYWDLNHAGHADNHGNDEYDHDDGSYNHDLDHAHESNDDHDNFDEPSEQLPTYGTEEYDSEQAAKYDESGRAKRAHPRIKTDRKLIREEETYEEPAKPHRKINQRLQNDKTQEVNTKDDVEENNEPPKRKRRQRRPENNKEENTEKQDDKINHEQEQSHHSVNQNQEQPQYYAKRIEKQEQEQNHHSVNQNQEQPQYYAKRTEKQEQNHQSVNQNQEQPQYYTKRTEKQFVPYEQGAGLRQHHQPDITPAASVPRLFLEPTTGHVVDRATGQAYVLQPIAINNYN